MKKKLTRFERARIIGARSLQIAYGAPVLVRKRSKSSIELARDEFQNGKVPISVLRILPDGSREEVETE